MPVRSIRGAFVQTKPKFGKNEENIEAAIKLAKTVRADLYVFPELCNTGYAFLSKEEAQDLSESLESGKSVEAFRAFSEKSGCALVAGLAENDDGRVYNSSVVIDRGSVLGKYRKMHLFYREQIWFSKSNDGFKVFDLNKLDCKIGPLICYDWVFPEASRELALQGADVICHPSNFVLPGKGQHGMTTRAFENGVFIITANRVGRENRGPKDKFRFTGLSQIVSPQMKKLASATETKPVAKSAKLDLSLARSKQITSMNHVFQERRPEFYTHLYHQVALETATVT